MFHGFERIHGWSIAVQLVGKHIGLGQKMAVLVERHVLDLGELYLVGVSGGETFEQWQHLVYAFLHDAFLLNAHEHLHGECDLLRLGCVVNHYGLCDVMQLGAILRQVVVDVVFVEASHEAVGTLCGFFGGLGLFVVEPRT